VRKFGYEEYDAPLIEPIEIYKAKSGEEIVSEQTYSFIDRGGREVAIRPEMTPSVSRMVASKRQQLGYPLRWFSIPNLWRYERPQRGRFREHWQLNVDLFGVKSTAAELELMLVADNIFKAFGASGKMYAFRINHRQLLDDLFTLELGLSKTQSNKVAHLIDRRSKIDHSAFLAQLDNLLTPAQKEKSAAEKLLQILEIKQLSDLPDKLNTSDAAQEVNQLLNACKRHGLNNVIFDISLVRGFDYYSGIVFELYDNDPDNKRAMLGGGRYDGLVGMFGVEPVPTAGFGLGDATLVNFLTNHHLLPELTNSVDLFVAQIGEGDAQDGAMQAASTLRELGLNVAVDYSGRKLGDQIKSAQKKSIRYVLIVGPKEVQTQKFTLRDINESKESSLDLKQIADKLKGK
ncbi:MAG: histidine--tRNA ligase, partial [Candidatus Saccharimonadales bacterium]